MNEKGKVTGGCFCGAVRFSLELPSKWCAHCHCTMCRRIHGAGYVTWVGFEEDRFRLHQGENELTWYSSSEIAERGFCNTCGSSMFFRSGRWEGEVHVALANIDDPIDRKPQAHAFHDSHVNWMPLDDALAIFNG
jgi:hypothetical protein